MNIPLAAYPILLKPQQVAENLERVRRSGVAEQTPSVWQIATGVMRMWHRMVYRPQTIGIPAAGTRPRSLRARFFEPRPLRFPFLLWEGSVAPLDLSGLATTPEGMIRHVIGTYHDGERFAYDVQILACYPGALEDLHEQTRQVVEGTHPRAEWLRDLCVYEGYHERLLAYLERVLTDGASLEPDDLRNPDSSFTAYLAWCAAQPETPRETLRALWGGRLEMTSTHI